MEKPSADEDVALLARIVQRDQGALSTLYDRYARILYSLAYKSLQRVEESEEVVLDVFTQVWRSAQSYDPQKGRVDTWLFVITRSRTLDRLRKLKRTQPTSTISLDAEPVQPRAEDIDLFEEALIAERRNRVLAALQTLSPEQRQLLELAYYQGLSQSQIATQTGLPLGTVKTRIRLGLSKLRTLFGPNQELWQVN